MNTSKLLSLGILLLGFISAENVAAEAALQPEPQSQSRSTITPAQMLKQANSHLEYMQGLKETIEKRLKIAKSKNDVMLTSALNPKLTAISSLIQSTEARIKSLQAASNRVDMNSAYHEFTVIMVLANRAQTMDTELAQLIGSDYYSGGLRNSEDQPVTTDTNMLGGTGGTGGSDDTGGGGGITPPVPGPPASPH